MTNTPHNTGPALAWLLRAADAEDACRSISVGGLAADLGMLSRPSGECIPSEPIPEPAPENRRELVKALINLFDDE